MATTNINFPIVRWVISIVGLGLAVLFSYLIPKWTGPVKRGFFCDDESIRYPYKENTVDPVLLGCVCYLIVILTIITTELLYNRLCLYAGTFSAGQIPSYKIGSAKIPYVIVRIFFAFAASQVGLAVGVVIMNMTKFSVGRLRPHFIHACKPNISLTECSNTHEYIEEFVCLQTDQKILLDSRLSFFSGHTSNAFYFAVFCALYVHIRLGRQFFDVIVFPLYYCFLISAAAFVGYSRIFDYKHHWSDVLVGAVVGCFFGVITIIYFRKLLVVPPIRPELRTRVQFVNEDETNPARVSTDREQETPPRAEQV